MSRPSSVCAVKVSWRLRTDALCRYIGDAKYGRLVGTDKFGNRFYENLDPNQEIPGELRLKT